MALTQVGIGDPVLVALDGLSQFCGIFTITFISNFLSLTIMVQKAWCNIFTELANIYASIVHVIA